MGDVELPRFQSLSVATLLVVDFSISGLPLEIFLAILKIY